MSQDPFAELKMRQREMWASFSPTAMFTTPVAGHLVKFAGIGAGETVLDVGTGTGVVAITAARAGARVTALDLTPELLVQAHENGRIAQHEEIVWTQGDAEQLRGARSAGDVLMPVQRCFLTHPGFPHNSGRRTGCDVAIVGTRRLRLRRLSSIRHMDKHDAKHH